MTTSGTNASSFEHPWAPIPGPVNRTTFFETQKTNRRATWRLSVFCTLAILFTGIPLSLVLAPPLYGVLLLAVALAKRYGAVPPDVWQTLVQMGTSFQAIMRHFSDKTPLPSMDVLLYAAAAFAIILALVQLIP